MEFDKKDVPKSTDSLMKVDQSNTFEKGNRRIRRVTLRQLSRTLADLLKFVPSRPIAIWFRENAVKRSAQSLG